MTYKADVLIQTARKLGIDGTALTALYDAGALEGVINQIDPTGDSLRAVDRSTFLDANGDIVRQIRDLVIKLHYAVKDYRGVIAIPEIAINPSAMLNQMWADDGVLNWLPIETPKPTAKPAAKKAPKKIRAKRSPVAQYEWRSIHTALIEAGRGRVYMCVNDKVPPVFVDISGMGTEVYCPVTDRNYADPIAWARANFDKQKRGGPTMWGHFYIRIDGGKYISLYKWMQTRNKLHEARLRNQNGNS